MRVNDENCTIWPFFLMNVVTALKGTHFSSPEPKFQKVCYSMTKIDVFCIF